MHHTPSAGTPARSPLAALDAMFLSLARGIRPLTLPNSLFTDRLGQPLPVDQVRARLAHPSCSPETRERIWSEVAFRARRDGEPWTTVVCGLAVPGLRRALSRLPRLGYLDPSEVEQEALTGLVAELSQIDPADPLLARRLIRAADRAAHQLVRKARARHAVQSEGEVLVDVPAVAPAEWESEGDEYSVLWEAVRNKVIGLDDADLIARTRLDLASVDHVAAQRGVSRRTVFRQRAAAEKSLGEALGYREQNPPQE